MSDRRGIFSLKLVRDLQADSEWENVNDVYIFDTSPVTHNAHNIGLFGTGAQGVGYYSSLGRLDFTTDTSSASTSTGSFFDPHCWSVSNTTNAYIQLGTPSVPQQTYMKYNYGTDTYELKDSQVTYYPYGPLSEYRSRIFRHYGSAVGNDKKAYIGGGYYSSSARRVNIFKLEYAADVISYNPSGVLTVATPASSSATTFGNLSAGYFSQGSLLSSVADKINYFSDNVSRVPSLNQPKNGLYGTDGQVAASDNNYAYLMGSAGPAGVGGSEIYKVFYSTEVMGVLPGATVSGEKYWNKSMSSGSAGYSTGGTANYAGSPLSIVDKLDFSTETVTNFNLPYTMNRHIATSANDNGLPNYGRFRDPTKTTYGYAPYLSPIPTSFSTTKFVNGLPAPAPPATPPGPVYTYRTTSDDYEYAYLLGMTSPGGIGAYEVAIYGRTGTFTQSWQMAYFGSVTPGLAPLPSDNDRSFYAGASSLENGYFAGGKLSPNYGGTPNPDAGLFSDTYKIRYITGTLSLTPSANLTEARAGAGGAGNKDTAFFVGGHTTNPSVGEMWGEHYSSSTTIDKITYSTESVNLVPGANASPAPGWKIQTFADNDKMYYDSGRGLFYRIPYVTDTHTFIPGAIPSVTYPESHWSIFGPDGSSSVSNRSAAGNGEYAYIVGGRDRNNPAQSYNYISVIDRFTYSTETIARSSDYQSRRTQGAVGWSTRDTAVFVGGYSTELSPYYRSIYETISYSTDTALTTNMTGSYTSGGVFGTACTETNNALWQYAAAERSIQEELEPKL